MSVDWAIQKSQQRSEQAKKERHEQEQLAREQQEREHEEQIRIYIAQRASIEDETRNLAIENPLANRWSVVPHEVHTGLGRLEWTLGDPAHHHWSQGKYAAGCLYRFIELADEKDNERFAEFARDYGVLGLSRANKSLKDSSVTIDGDVLNTGEYEYWRPGVADGSVPPWVDPQSRRHDIWFWEPLDGWREYARHAKAILSATVSLRRGEPVRDDDRAIIYNEQRFVFTPKDLIAEQQGVLAYVVSQKWLRNAGMVPRLRWNVDDVPRMTVHVGGWDAPRTDPNSGLPTGWPIGTLFSTLALQLAAAICSGERLLRCSICSKIYIAEGGRKPRSDTQQFCGDVCREEAGRIHKKTSAAKRRARERSTKVDSHFDSQVGR